jgi:hypothetical protein
MDDDKRFSKIIPVQRRFVTAGLGLGAAATLLRPRQARADTAFTSFSFQATGGNTNRTMPDRLGEVANVVELGADRTGRADSQPAFQAAANTYKNLYVPPGTYRINSAVDFSGLHELTVRGAGAPQVLINSNFAGFVFDNSSTSSFAYDVLIEGLSIKNTHASGGGIRNRSGDNFQVRNCHIQAHIGVQMSGVSPNDTCFSGCVSNCRIQALSGNEMGTGSIGVVAGPETAIQNCSIVNFDNNVRAYGGGGYIHGCRIEVGTVGIVFGMDATGAPFQAAGWHFAGTTMEANLTGVALDAISGLVMDGVVITSGTNGPPNGTGHSVCGIQFNAGSGLVMTGCLITGSFTTAAFNVNSGAGNQGQPEATFVSCSFAGWNTVPGNTLEGWEAYNCKGIPTFSIPISYLTHLSYLQPGARRVVTDCTTTTFGTAVTNTGGTVARNNGGANEVPVWKRSDGNGLIG